jgi:manganese efflux pump family protein
MAWGALAAWVTTALGGATLAVPWLRHGGHHQTGGIGPARLLLHVSLAVTGLGLWVGFLSSGNHTLAWIAVGLLVAVASVGLVMLAHWLRGRSGDTETELPAEAAFPLPIVLLHGALGITTLALSALAASGVGA